MRKIASEGARNSQMSASSRDRLREKAGSAPVRPRRRFLGAGAAWARSAIGLPRQDAVDLAFRGGERIARALFAKQRRLQFRIERFLDGGVLREGPVAGQL